MMSFKCPKCGWTSRSVGDELSKQITEYRASNNISQEAFAREIGVARVTVARWEAGAVPHTYFRNKLKKKGIDHDVSG